MTPGARVAAAIEILDRINEGLSAEQALTRWARRSRFAGSKDRAAIRDHVFDVLRNRRTAAHFGQGETGRSLMIGLLRQQGADLGELFDGVGHAPAPLSGSEATMPEPPTATGVLWNLPDWLVPLFEQALGSEAGTTARALQSRAPVFLRVNAARGTLSAVLRMLGDDAVKAQPSDRALLALKVLEGERRIRNSEAFTRGYVELQDASSQAVVETLPRGGRVLDFCAGGGGKALALAADRDRQVFAHDIDPGRMSDLSDRADRAGVRITTLPTGSLAGAGAFDVILCDAPCSGSGAWRRAPEGKWTLTPERLQSLTTIQDDILEQAAALLPPDGLLAYATCSVLRSENEARVEAFLAGHPGWQATLQQRFAVDEDGDGFFVAHLTRLQM